MKFIRKVKYKTNDILKKGLGKLYANSMELPSKLSEQIAFNATPKTEEHMLIVVDKPTQEVYLSQPLQTKIKKF